MWSSVDPCPQTLMDKVGDFYIARKCWDSQKKALRHPLFSSMSAKYSFLCLAVILKPSKLSICLLPSCSVTLILLTSRSYRGIQWCYVDSYNTCTDVQRSPSGKLWSYEACATPLPTSYECQGSYRRTLPLGARHPAPASSTYYWDPSIDVICDCLRCAKPLNIYIP